MSNATWFYARGQQQTGPVTFDELKRLAAAGQLRREDKVWADGTPAWVDAGSQPGLFVGPEVDPAVLLPTESSASLGYFEPSSGLPPRAAATLRGHARPTGETGEWPLDDARVEQFDRAVRLRKKITAVAQLYRLLFALAAIGCTAVFIALAVDLTLSTGRGRGPGTAAAAGFSAGLGGIALAVTLLYYFAWRSTTRSQRWAPLTMFILFMLGVAFNVLGIVVATVSGRPADQVAAVIGGGLGSVLPGAFAYLSWRAYAAIPKFLAQPAWCQELIVKSGI